MKGRKSERIILHKMIQYCNKITQILENHHFNRDERVFPLLLDWRISIRTGGCVVM